MDIQVTAVVIMVIRISLINPISPIVPTSQAAPVFNLFPALENQEPDPVEEVPGRWDDPKCLVPQECLAEEECADNTLTTCQAEMAQALLVTIPAGLFMMVALRQGSLCTIYGRASCARNYAEAPKAS
jgi:hypothetical protein